MFIHFCGVTITKNQKPWANLKKKKLCAFLIVCRIYQLDDCVAWITQKLKLNFHQQRIKNNNIELFLFSHLRKSDLDVFVCYACICIPVSCSHRCIFVCSRVLWVRERSFYLFVFEFIYFSWMESQNLITAILKSVQMYYLFDLVKRRKKIER